MTLLSIAGYGRVGSYANAKRAGRSRARKYWAIVEWSDDPRVPGKPIMGKLGWVKRDDFDLFKTQKAARDRLLEYANEINATVIEETGYAKIQYETD